MDEIQSVRTIKHYNSFGILKMRLSAVVFHKVRRKTINLHYKLQTFKNGFLICLYTFMLTSLSSTVVAHCPMQLPSNKEQKLDRTYDLLLVDKHFQARQ